MINRDIRIRPHDSGNVALKCYPSSFRHSMNGFHYLWTVAHIWCKFGISIHHRNMQVTFEFGHGRMIFDRAIPLEINFTFRSLTFVWMYVYGSNCMCRFIIGIWRSSSNLVLVHRFFTELSLLNKTNRNFQSPFIISVRVAHI
jgi:hypothetical protein